MHTLSQLVGLDLPIRALRGALAADQVAGTHLFVGPDGVGKTALALAFAAAAACPEPQREPYDACGNCRSCRLLAAASHPEITLIAPAGDATQLWQFWDRDGRPPGSVQSTISYAPSLGRRRVYIVERADTLTEAAANSLLKVLEEPPSYALFVLLSPHPSRMLPTVLSRAQALRLQPMPISALTAYLEHEEDVPAQRARTLASLAEGRVGRALRLARSAAGMEEVDRVLDFVSVIPSTSPLGALRISEGMRKLASSLRHVGAGDSAKDASANAPTEDAPTEADGGTGKERTSKQQLSAIVDLAAAYYRDVLAVALLGSEAGVVHVDRRAEIECVAERLPPQECMSCLGALLAARRWIDQNASPSLLTDWLATRLVLQSA